MSNDFPRTSATLSTKDRARVATLTNDRLAANGLSDRFHVEEWLMLNEHAAAGKSRLPVARAFERKVGRFSYKRAYNRTGNPTFGDVMRSNREDYVLVPAGDAGHGRGWAARMADLLFAAAIEHQREQAALRLGQNGERYFLRIDEGPWVQVDEAAWCRAEGQAGFFPKGGRGPATGGFGSSASRVSGKMGLNDRDPNEDAR